jgi:RNA recognition motif-containing protein
MEISMHNILQLHLLFLVSAFFLDTHCLFCTLQHSVFQSVSSLRKSRNVINLCILVQTSQFGQMGSHVPMQIGTLQSTSSMGLTQQYSTQMQGGKVCNFRSPFTPVSINTPSQGRGQDSALWMGEIETWMDENFLMSLFIHTGECSHVKIIRDKNTGLPAGYAFIHFNSLHAAQKVLENFQGQPIPGTTKHFRLNWATHTSKAQQQQQQQSFAQQQMRPQITSQASHMTEQQQSQLAQTLSQLTSTQIEELSLFVGDLAPDVNNYFLQSTFQYYYPSCYNARVVVDPQTGQSKGYGFVYFTDETEKNRALTEMQGYYLSYRPIKLNLAVKKAPKQTQQPGTLLVLNE